MTDNSREPTNQDRFSFNLFGSKVVGGQTIDAFQEGEAGEEKVTAICALVERNRVAKYVAQFKARTIVIGRFYSFRLVSGGGNGLLGEWLFRSFLKGKLFLRSLPSRLFAPRNFAVNISQSLPSDYEALWQSIKNTEVLALWKDALYLERRYNQVADGGEHEYFCGTVAGRLSAVAVVSKRGRDVFITELVVEGRNTPVARLLVNFICSHYLGQGMSTISFIGHDRGFFSLVFCDFVAMPQRDLTLVGRLVEKDAVLERIFFDETNWCITGGDLFVDIPPVRFDTISGA